MKRIFFAFLVFLNVALYIPFLSAQELSSLSGVVTDNTGAVISAADVKLLDTKTNANYETKTNSVGGYTFVKLMPGPGYKLTVSKDGFESFAVSNIYVGVGATFTQNVQMQIGAITQTVEVSATSQPVSLDTTDTTVGTNFDMTMVHELPIQNRDSPIALIALQPGVTTAHASSDDPNSSRDGAVTGARTDQTNVTLDGLDVNDFATGQSFTVSGNAPVDSIQEFHGETANPLAASGRGSGAQVQFVTKSGTNQWHGALFEYHRNTVTEANNIFNVQSGTPTPKLIQNFFGGNVGGPIKKDKLFFFFNYQARRDAREDSVLATVPLDSFRAGNLGYINNSSGCTFTSRINTTPGCISFLDQTALAANDPQGVGGNTALLSFINGRYPRVNDPTGGDGLNTGGFRFNAPAHRTANDYVGRIDYNLTEKMKLFSRFSILRDTSGDDANNAAPFQFPGDPVTHQIVDRSYAYVFGHTWTISSNKVNQFFYGETRSDLNFPVTFNPLGTTYYSFFGPLATPYQQQESQHRVIPIPVYRDDFTYVRGKHNLQMGGTFKPIRTDSNQVNDLNFVSVGLGGHLGALDPTHRPADLLASTTARSRFDNAYPFILGRFANINSNFNNDSSLNALPNGTGHTRNYRYYETEVYFQDTWRMRQDLTMTYGLRYQYYSVPYETNGAEAIPDLDLAQFYNGRVPIGLAGDFSNQPPLLSYNFGGKAKHAPGLYEPDWKDFAPRFALAYNPSAEGGFFGKLLGNRKTVIRAGSGLVFDHPVTAALNFIQDQSNYIFQSSASEPFGVAQSSSVTPLQSTVQSLQNDPRFTTITDIPTPPSAPTVSVPFTPFTDGGVADGLASGGPFNYAIDRNLKTPYSIVYSFGIQRELPGNFLLDLNYFGRLGRRLMAQADAGQFVDFQDVFSPGHSLAGDFFAVTKEIQSGVDPAAVTPQPFWEDFFGPGATQDLASSLPFFGTGDLTDTVANLLAIPGLGIGLHPQFGSNVYIANKGYSSYNGLLATLHKRLSHGLQFDVNYTYSHSVDNGSSPSNNVAGAANFSGALVCDITNLKACRGNSDFDVTHIITGNFIYELPVGRGRQFGSSMPGWANQIIGGWQLSGIPQWRTGFAFSTVSGAFPISFFNNAPAVFIGQKSALKQKIHFSGTGFQIFSDPDQTIASFRGPESLAEGGGSRNNLRGPGYANLDLGIAKHFPIGERFVVEFRADAYNVFNHVNFGLPGTGGSGGTADITDPSSFGVIRTAAAPRQMQFALRLDF